MGRFGLIAMALLAVLAVGAFAASSAFALPEISKPKKMSWEKRRCQPDAGNVSRIENRV